MMKKGLCLFAAAALAVSMLAGCSSGTTDSTSTSGDDTAATAESTSGAEGADASVSDGEVIKIGVIQQMQHASLDDAYNGFVDGLAEAGYVDGENIEINFQNASGEISNCQSICDSFANNGTDLVLAIATSAAQSAVNTFKDTDTPVLFTAVTDAEEAGLVESNEAPGREVTGTLDMPVIADQIQVIKDVLPDAQTLGIIYTSSEANSEIQAKEAQTAAEGLGMDVVIQTASTTNDIPQVISSVVNANVDAIYIPSDNAMASAMATVNSQAVDAQVPVFCAVEAMIEEGGIATTAINYYDLGKQTAEMAVRIFNGEKASEIPVETQNDLSLVVNKTFAESVGVTIPDDVLSKAVTVY